ncbi:Tim44/TimA family putative adaptor protein [Roseomonas sp. HJA6]|uniref:Tim44/TimA family putative adaptor protein n=1 Tax=Roseomonas alba TaxID=2846776 RepID=A0ABS7A802_9PROT|nr:Tim44/TimA family putative adaptor protein [Neoroseomonas alba]MBW6398422.1 Tim44/TimA family putative adaptor protein [Neoroseomonas alba]
MTGGLPIDLILFAMVAAFLVLRLRSVLGRRTGFERQPGEATPGAAVPPAAREAELPPPPQAGAAMRALPDPRSPLGQSLMRIRGVDPAFEPGAFLGGAEGAFRMIVQAFAAGDRDTLRNLLSEEAFAGFDQAISARETAGATQRTELRAIHDMAIEEAELKGTIADITVRIVSDQVNLTIAQDGSIAAGAEAVTEITDLWTFQRDLRSSDPTWRLVGTRSA